jgi:hypothetical protein
MARSSGIASGAAKAPLALGSLRPLGVRGSFLVCDGIAPRGVNHCLNCQLQITCAYATVQMWYTFVLWAGETCLQ